MHYLEEATSQLVEGLCLHAKGQDKLALKLALKACQGYDKGLADGSLCSIHNHIKERQQTALAVCEALMKKKPVLDVATKIVYISSLISKYPIYPWQFDPLLPEFEGDYQFEDPDVLELSSIQKRHFTAWKRPADAIGPDFCIDGPGRLDIYQDALQDCSVVASLLSIVRLEERTGKNLLLSSRLYPQKNGRPILSPCGKYKVKLNLSGTERMVTIDDRLPCSANSHQKRLVVSSSTAPILWPALLEKAYMKAMGGYEFEGSHAAKDTFVYSGWIPEYVSFKAYTDTHGSFDHLWYRIKKGWDDGNVMLCVGTGTLSREERQGIGLISDHDYTVLDIDEDETNGQRLVCVCNPWNSSGTTDASDGDVKIALKDRPTKDGRQFWLPFESLCLWFQSLYLNWNPDLYQFKTATHFLWGSDAIEWSQTTKTYEENPQFVIRNNSPEPVETTLLFSRHTLSATSATGYFSIDLYKAEGRKITVPEEEPKCLSGTSINTSYHSLQFSMPPKTSITAVCVASEVETQEKSLRFSLTAYSTNKLELTRAQSSGHVKYRAIQQGEWTKDSAGGNWSRSTYRINPQFSLAVKDVNQADGKTNEPDILKVFLLSPTNAPLNVQLFWSGGKPVRGYSEKNVLATSGSYRARNCMTTIRNVQSGHKYTAVVSTYEPSPQVPFTLIVKSSQGVELNPLGSETAGLFTRSVQLPWNGTNRKDIGFRVNQRSKALVELHTVSPNHTNEEHTYRPDVRVSIFDGTTMVSSSMSFRDAFYGVYLDDVRLEPTGEYIAVVERMEAGEGMFSLYIHSSSPVNWID